MRAPGPHLSFIIPTRNRAGILLETLRALEDTPLPPAELIVVDNASDAPLSLPSRLRNGIELTLIRLDENEGAAARNRAAERARAPWLVMLDDDSHPVDTGLLRALADAPPDVAAVGAEIFLPSGAREAGGLPEVFIGCAVAIRRAAFLAAGGYDPSFSYYAEEYDLAAKLLLAGHRVIHDRRFRALHRKVTQGRDMNLILQRLVRNNVWTMQRYAPEPHRRERIDETVRRYAEIAQRESAVAGYARGVEEAVAALLAQPRTPMSDELFARFTGLAAAREALGADGALRAASSAAIVDAGKNEWAVRRALEEIGKAIIDDDSRAEALVIGSLSPGPLTDALERRRAAPRPVIAPWRFAGE